MLEEKELVV